MKTYLVLFCGLFAIYSCKNPQKKEPKKELPQTITFTKKSQNPEGVEYDPVKKVFYLSSINREAPQIVTVDFEGNVTPFSNDGEDQSMSSFGLQLDTKNNRLLACVNYKNKGFVYEYNRDNGNLESTINLSDLTPDSKHQANDLVVDDNNTIYVTGRLENVIYKISPKKEVSIFYQNDSLTFPNGIAYHKDGFLLVSYSNKNSSLFKIPTDDSSKASKISLADIKFKGFDGLLLTKQGSLVGVTKAPDGETGNRVIELTTTNNWQTANVKQTIPVSKSTTIARVSGNEYYVINQDWKNFHAENWILEKATLK